MRQDPGFTLVEMIIVTAVLALLIAFIVLPQLGDRRHTASNTGALNCARAIQNTQALHSTRAGAFATSMNELAGTNSDMLDACGWDDPDTPYNITGDPTAHDTYNFTVSSSAGDATYAVTPSAITATE